MSLKYLPDLFLLTFPTDNFLVYDYNLESNTEPADCYLVRKNV